MAALNRFSVGAADSVFSPSAKLLALLHDNKRYHTEENQDKPKDVYSFAQTLLLVYACDSLVMRIALHRHYY